MFRVKQIIAHILDFLLLNRIMLCKTNQKYNSEYIRCVNYHATPESNKDNFERQLKWYKKHFRNVNEELFEKFLGGAETLKDMPGIMITFDDGYKSNMEIAKPLLEKYGFTGYFFVSSELVGTEGYMDWDELRQLRKSGHVVGCHTATHHRMNDTDSEELLEKEIVLSKAKLEAELQEEIFSFCWCGGEEEHYTKCAGDKIKKAGYKYSFLTNSHPILPKSNHLLLERINVEDAWSCALMRFQVSGWMDLKFKKKRERVEELLR